MNLTKTFWHLIYLSAGLTLVFSACKQNTEADTAEENNYIEMVTNVMDFQILDTIPSGWNTFHWSNNSPEAHFFLMEKYPEGKTVQDFQTVIAPTFQNGMNFINEGKMDEAMDEFGKLPEWSTEVVYSGGSGLVSPKRSSITTIHLDPGYYVMECYVKMNAGVFHAAMGMSKGIVVSAEDSGLTPPEANIQITISSEEGIAFAGPVTAGTQVFAVTFTDQIVHEHFVGHDVNLVKLEESADLDALQLWMDWSQPEGLRSPGPEGVVFMGGVNDCPTGSTGYFEVELLPGNYAFIAEVPNAMEKNMLKTFTIEDGPAGD